MNIFKAARTGNVKVLECYIQHGADLTQRKGEYGDTVLHVAADQNLTECVRMLLAAGADIESKTYEDLTPLHHAVSTDEGADCARILIDAGANVHGEPGEHSILHLAANNGKTDAIQMLLDAGANVNAQNERGETPLHSAAGMNFSRSVQVLLKGGADPTIPNYQKQLPEDVARNDETKGILRSARERVELGITANQVLSNMPIPASRRMGGRRL
jgi:ankyrin repeat protein